MKNRDAFTLIEILIVLVIVAMLMGVLFDIYITISRITFRVELQKNVNNELLFVSDTLQNLSNRNEINYSGYNVGGNDSEFRNILFTNNGITDILYLSGEDGNVSLYASGCDGSGYCGLFMNKDGKEIKLTQDKVLFKNTKFKIIPFESSDSYKCEEIDGKNAYKCRNNPGFWFITQMYSQNYDKDRWTHNVYLNVQQFFNN